MTTVTTVAATTIATTKNPFSNPSIGKKRVVVVGAGFGGLNVAKGLANDDNIELVVIDRRNHHLFQPLLYQVATAGLNPGDIATPIRTVVGDQKNTTVLWGEVKKVDLGSQQLETDFGPVAYDYLVMACGAQHSYFGHPEWEPFAPGLKTLEQATEIRRRILSAFELAERETNPEIVHKHLTFAVVGGGPTGVEMAGAISEIARFSLNKDFRHINPRNARIILIEAGPRLLPSFDPKLSLRATNDLEKMGVTNWVNTRVTKISDDGVELGKEKLHASTVIWAAGVKASVLNETLGLSLDRSGRVSVLPDLSLEGHPNAFVIGDQANAQDKGKQLPGLAPVAMQQGRFIAKLIGKEIQAMEKPFKRAVFHYTDKGQMATIGRRKAVAQTDKFKIGGALAWYAWLVVHIFYLVGFKNRSVVIFEWAWSYLTFRRGAQLITSPFWESQDQSQVSANGVVPMPKGVPLNSTDAHNPTHA